MKQILLSAALAAITALNAAAQQVQFTLVATDANNLQLYFRPDANIPAVTTGISNVTFVLQIPTTYPDPDGQWTIVPNPAYLGVASTTTTASTANGAMHNTLVSFTANPNIAGTPFAANTEYLLATISTPTGVATTDVILTDWGNNRIDNAAIGAPLWATSLAIDGADVTNDAAIFYSNLSTLPAANSGDPALQSTLSIDIPLAVTLLSFTGKMQPDGSLLEWKVAGEENIDFYEVQYSTRPTEWLYAGTIKARNIGNAEGTYTFRHKPEAGVNEIYYRLKIRELNGRFDYSNTIKLQRNGAANNEAVKVYPTALASGNTLHVIFPSNDNSTKQLMILNVAGQVVKQLPTTTNTEFSVNTSGLAAGAYFLTNAANDQSVALSRFTVQ